MRYQGIRNTASSHEDDVSKTLGSQHIELPLGTRDLLRTRRIDMNLSRRDFLDQTLWTAAAALAAGGVTMTQLAEDVPRAKGAGPNDKMRVAVIGGNGPGSAHLGEWLKNPDVDLVAVCDCDPAAYQKHVAQVQGPGALPRYVQDVRKLLEDKNHRRRLHRHAQSLARPDGGVGHAGRQGRVRRKAVQPQRPRRPRDDPVGPQTRPDVPDGRPEPQHDRHAPDARIHPQRQDRQGRGRARDLLPPPRQHRPRRYRSPDSRRARLSTCGAARRPKIVPKRKRLHYDWHWVLCHRQRRPRKSESARAGQGPLGPRQAGIAQTRRQPRRPAGLHRQRRRAPTAR